MLNSSFLIQRLKTKPKGEGLIKNAHRVFGGGMMGLSTEAWDLCDDVFTIDYMGAAEYEMGTFPDTLNEIVQTAKAGDLTHRTITVKRKDIEKNDARKWAQDKAKLPPKLKGAVEVYIVGTTADMDEIEERVRGLVAGKVEVRDSTQIQSTLDPINEWDGEVRGWLDIKNGFFFFTNETMWRGVREWFDLEDK